MPRTLQSKLLALGIGTLIAAAGCGGGGGGEIPPPPPPPPTVSITISPTTAQPFLGQTQQFTPTVTGSTNTAVTWSVNGITGGTPATGTISATGLYAAPQILPSPATVGVTATSQADPAKTATAQVTVRSDLAVTTTPPSANVELGATQTFTRAVTGTGSFNTDVTWSVNGVVGGSTTFGTITTAGLYTAPRILPAAPAMTITATSVADNSKSATSTANVTSTFIFSISGSFTVVNGAFADYLSSVTEVPGSNPDRGATWSVSGTGCTGAACGIIDSTGRYTAPSTTPNPATVTITGTSVADPRRSASLNVTIQSQIAVFVSPATATVSAGATQQFLVNVAGDNSNAGVTWSVAGPSCIGATCGTIDANGLYTAPNPAPSPNNQVNVTATSNADPAKSATATLTIASTGPNITKILPGSIIAGPAGGFTFKVQGSNFTAGSSGSGSTILFRGSNRVTTCAFGAECTIFLEASDVALPGNIPVQVRNPDGAFSNQVVFMAVAPATTPDIVTLTSGSPEATNKDIIVVEPTTAGSGAAQINLDQIAVLINNTCSLRSSSVSITRPTPLVGTLEVEICLVGNGLSASTIYTVSGPIPNDITILSVDATSFPIRLKLSISSTTLLGPRTIFVENANKEKVAAPGALDVRAP